MSVTSHDLIELVAGDTWTLTATLLDAAGNPFDLTGATIVWTLKDARLRRTALTCSLGSGITVTDALAGHCTITVAPAVSALVALGTYQDKCRATSSDGTVATEWEGFIVVKP